MLRYPQPTNNRLLFHSARVLPSDFFQGAKQELCLLFGAGIPVLVQFVLLQVENYYRKGGSLKSAATTGPRRLHIRHQL